MNLFSYAVNTPLGTITYICDSDANIYALYFPVQEKNILKYLQKNIPSLHMQHKNRGPHDKIITDYFKGKGAAIQQLPTKVFGTELQKKVWNMLKKYTFGELATYKEIAKKVSKPLGVRAVASAIGKNPVSLCIPCHRVIASNGSLSGYAGGIDKKAWLLEHESR